MENRRKTQKIVENRRKSAPARAKIQVQVQVQIQLPVVACVKWLPVVAFGCLCQVVDCVKWFPVLSGCLWLPWLSDCL